MYMYIYTYTVYLIYLYFRLESHRIKVQGRHGYIQESEKKERWGLGKYRAGNKAEEEKEA